MSIMKKFLCVLLGIVLTVQSASLMSAKETDLDRFRQQIIAAMEEEGSELTEEEINQIIDEVGDKFIKYYGEQSEENGITKSEKLLSEMAVPADAYSNYSQIAEKEGKAVEQVMLEEDNPKLLLYPKESYYYDNESKDIVFNMTKDEMFRNNSSSSQNTNGLQPAALLDSVGRGDILFNFDNGSSSFKWGHAALVESKGATKYESYTIKL